MRRTTRKQLLQKLWTKIVNAHLRPDDLDNTIKYASDPDQPFGDTGPAIERILAAGASRRDLALLLRYTAYSAVFSTLYEIEDPNVDNSDLVDLHEFLLSADPSGMEGYPGSADAASATKARQRQPRTGTRRALRGGRPRAEKRLPRAKRP